MSFGELAAQWDGIGLVVSARAPDVEGMFTAERQRLLMAAGIVAIGIIVIHGVMGAWSAKGAALSRQRRMALSVGQGCMLGLASLLCGLSSNWANRGEGLLANAEGVRSIRRAHLGGFVPTIGVTKVEESLEHGCFVCRCKVRA